MHGEETCMAEGHAWQRGMHGKEGMCGKGVCRAGGMCGKEGMRGRRDGHCSGRYAFYWNAFLFKCIPIRSCTEKPMLSVLFFKKTRLSERTKVSSNIVLCVVFKCNQGFID